MDLRRTHSICYMSLADAFLTRLQQEAESRSKSRIQKEGVTVQVLAVREDKQDFIYSYLTKIYEQRQGTFSKPKTFAKQTIYECERSNVCKGSSSGDPTKTRANGCSAYVSFMFEEGATVTACVVRCRLTHTGHDPNNREESRVSRIDLKLRFLIETQLTAGMKVSEVMGEVAKWNKTHGFTEHHNRRYFPTRQDIQQMALTLRRPSKPPQHHPQHTPNRKPKKYDTLGKDNAAQVIKSDLRDWCVFHQSRTMAGPAPRPLVVVVQSSAMREVMVRGANDVLCVENNFEGLRQYGSAVYVLAVRGPGGDAHPGAYIVTSDDHPLTFLQAFTELHEHCPLNPRVVLLDREIQGFSEGLATLLPNTLFLFPWVQLAQEVHRWLQVSGKEDTGVQRMLLQCLQELRACDTKETFVEAVGGLEGRVGVEEFGGLVWGEWLSHPTRWSDFGRVGVWEDLTHSAGWERFFLRLHHQFLKGVHTRTLPDLLKLLTTTVTHTKNAADNLLEMSLLLDGSAGERAAGLIKQGWAQLVTWQGGWEAHVPCHTLLETSYTVNLVTMECECPELTLEGPCVHLCLVSSLAQVQQGASLQQERQRVAREALDRGHYLLEEDCCITFHSGGVCVTEMASGVCTCVAAALNTACVGVLVVELAREAGHTHSGLARDTGHTPIPSQGHPIIPHPIKTEGPSSHQPPIVIQTHTGLPDSTKDMEEEQEDPLADSSLSSKALLEKLYLWSTSKDFTDSDILHSLLQATHDTVWGRPSPPTPPRTSPHPKLGTWDNKKLRAVVRPVRRKEEEEEEVICAPPTKVTRSGRTVKVKDEPDFVT